MSTTFYAPTAHMQHYVNSGPAWFQPHVHAAHKSHGSDQYIDPSQYCSHQQYDHSHADPEQNQHHHLQHYDHHGSVHYSMPPRRPVVDRYDYQEDRKKVSNHIRSSSPGSVADFHHEIDRVGTPDSGLPRASSDTYMQGGTMYFPAPSPSSSADDTRQWTRGKPRSCELKGLTPSGQRVMILMSARNLEQAEDLGRVKIVE